MSGIISDVSNDGFKIVIDFPVTDATGATVINGKVSLTSPEAVTAATLDACLSAVSGFIQGVQAAAAIVPTPATVDLQTLVGQTVVV